MKKLAGKQWAVTENKTEGPIKTSECSVLI